MKSAVFSTSFFPLAVFMEKAQSLKRRVIAAMIYPVVVIIIAVLIVTGIRYFVIPKFIEIFNDFEVEIARLDHLLDGARLGLQDRPPDQQIPGATGLWSVPSLFLFSRRSFGRLKSDANHRPPC